MAEPTPFRRILYGDRCPRCMQHVLSPLVRLDQGDQACCMYRCPCGHTWSCNWSIRGVEGWDTAA